MRMLLEYLVAQSLARQDRHRRIKPQRLVEYRPRINELRHVGQRRRPPAEHAVEFGMELGFDFGRLRQQIPEPGQRIGGRFMAGHEQDRDLVAQRFGVERLASLDRVRRATG